MNWLLDHSWAWYLSILALVLGQAFVAFLIAKAIHRMRDIQEADKEAALEGDRVDAAYERGREEGWRR